MENTVPSAPKRLISVLAILCSVMTGLVFLYSGFTKLLPVIETFEFTFVDIGLGNWYTAPFIARALIGIEFFLGILLLACYRLKTFTIPLASILLLLFTVYLLISIAFYGNTGNCGCFGEQHYMSPALGIIKNLILLGSLAFTWFFHNGWQLQKNILLLSLLAISATSLPFLINPVDLGYTSNNLEEKVNYPLNLDLLYAPDDTVKVERPSEDLRQNKHVVAFLSLTCPHCRIAAKKFRLIKKNNPGLPIYFILNGHKKNYADFIKDTRADNIPGSFCSGKTFVQLASSQLPRIYYLHNSVVVKKVDYFELSQYDIEDWIAKGKTK